MNGSRSPLEEAEAGISDCPLYDTCNSVSECSLSLSQIRPGAERRGHRNPRVLLVTEAPDEGSSGGTAYQGGVSARIENFFCKDEYGIGLVASSFDGFSEFLRNFRFYATSAVKCCISGGGGSDVGRIVIENCTNEYLSSQIEAMPQLELIIPMGSVATAALLRRNPSELRLTSILGSPPQGIQSDHDRWGTDIVVLPHPSGVSPLSNPPIVDGEGGRRQWSRVRSFRSALRAVRDRLDSMGYDVLDDDPACWGTPDGLFRF